MADAYGQVSPEVEGRKRAILEAVATGGTRGLQAFEESEKAIQAGKTGAIQRSQAIAKLIGGAEAQGFEAIPTQQYDARLTDNAQRRTGFSEDMARLGSAGNRALTQLGALAPLFKAQTEKSLAKQANEAMMKDWEARALGQAEMEEEDLYKKVTEAQKGVDEIDKLQAKREKGADSATKEFTAANNELNKWRTKLQEKGLWDSKKNQPKPGANELGTNYDAVLRVQKEKEANYKKHTERSGGGLGGNMLPAARATRLKALEAAQGAAQRPRSDRARDIATSQFGIPQDLAYGKLGPEDIQKARQPGSPLTAMQQKAIKSAGLSEQDYAEVQSDKDYDAVASFLNQNLAGISKDEVVAYILSKVPAHKKRTRALFRAEFEGQALTAAQLKRLEEG